MTAQDLLQNLHSNGLSLAAIAGKITVDGPRPLTDDQVAILTTHRAELLQVEPVRILNAAAWVADLVERGQLAPVDAAGYRVDPFWALTFPPGNCPIRDPVPRTDWPRRGRAATKPGPH